MFGIIRDYLRKTDWWIIVLCMVSSALSVLLLLSIRESFPDYVGKRSIIMQIGASFVGFVFMIALSLFDYAIFTRFWYIHFPLCILFVGLTFVIGVGRAGADDKAWLSIMGVSVQPSEFLKISMILTFAAQVDKIKEGINTFAGIVRLCLVGLIPFVLVVLQGDDGSAMVFLMIFVCMMFAAGVSGKLMAVAGGFAAVALPLVWNFIMSNDQKLRFLVLFDENASSAVVYQQNMALQAMSYGGMWGKGLLGESYNYIPEMHNDMIFSFVGNALGFVGCCVVLVVLCMLCVRILLAGRETKDSIQGKVICTGIFSMLAFQTIINIGMNLKVMPIVGITLPLFSAGGSSVLMTYLAIGVALNVYRQTHIKSLY